ncbi:endonuclease/exonuclease/phosphatase family protein [Aromatoleum toluolicum]|uniref:Endonuclease/exonuclease/phosphatase domain-containing protein n=1 Tax=Aromatoleum toluolicum TaxID=90060 RepID=A0ABX1NA53_9RHOO|nr:endonuclease/exonuclease/phosphatase family protein [Aromatoleum toluolicum]NMF96149.1 endonuclease/exonuclease/phosphatase family protein [Aromatoleum toluolicum]
MSIPENPLVLAITKRVRILLALSVLGAALPILASLLPKKQATLAWALDLAVHWQWVYVVLGVLCIIWLVGLGTFHLAAPAAALLTAGFFWTGSTAYSAGASQSNTLTVVTANLNADNQDTTALRTWADELSADIVVLEEVTPGVVSQLERWKAYPYQTIHAQVGLFGLAILSKHPLEDTQALEEFGQTLHVRTRVRWRDTEFALAAVHPMPPLNAEYHTRREELFHTESNWATGSNLPSIIAGDFNASPWSRAFRPFNNHGMRLATALKPTWPAVLPMIPIDHVITSGHWQVVRAGVGPRIGSDHRPAYAVLAQGTR